MLFLRFVAMERFIVQGGEDGGGRVLPDLGEGFFFNIAEGVVAPELVGVDGAIPAYAGDFFTDFVATIDE